MGTLLYGTSETAVDIDDRPLVHLQQIIITKLRRHESFSFTWVYPVNEGSGKRSLWMHEAVPLQFVFHGSRAIPLNAEWLQALARSASSTAGLVLTPEPQSRVPAA